ncbi:helix-turn-helix domain-containing protein [Pontibacter russatus]|uniref:helix-turn-helix domain-containing protein n=1 Tax=Pontibacter russatus TaxID=2694929 RepID=UPI00192A3F2C|nr:helix-turn-helix transcriptional regulator [Pontibacter russatus]
MKNPAGIKAFGVHLRKIREQRGISQQELADIANVSKLTVQRTENAKYSVTLDVLLSFAHGLQIPLKELLDLDVPDELS